MHNITEQIITNPLPLFYVMDLYDTTSFEISELVTRRYSTSFSKATAMLEPEKRRAICSIYGFVRLADEIVDTFHNHNKRELLDKFEADYVEAQQNGISLNPVLNAFVATVNTYKIEKSHIDAFLLSMKNDLDKTTYTTQTEINQYIYGSADVVGLMCLKVFCNGNADLYNELEKPAMRLGSAFQKVNFLRDLKNDTEVLNRQYFPNITKGELTEFTKHDAIADIEADFKEAYKGLVKLPGRSKLAVLIAYRYYYSLLNKLKQTPASQIAKKRIRVPDWHKLLIFTRTKLSYQFNLL